MTKPTKWHVRPAKTQIGIGIRPVWSEPSLCDQRVAKDTKLSSCAQRILWSDWSKSSLGAQSFCWFCRAAAHVTEVFFFFKSIRFHIWQQMNQNNMCPFLYNLEIKQLICCYRNNRVRSSNRNSQCLSWRSSWAGDIQTWHHAAVQMQKWVHSEPGRCC